MSDVEILACTRCLKSFPDFCTHNPIKNLYYINSPCSCFDEEHALINKYLSLGDAINLWNKICRENDFIKLSRHHFLKFKEEIEKAIMVSSTKTFKIYPPDNILESIGINKIWDKYFTILPMERNDGN